MDKPLVSFCLFTYNQEKYIKEAILGALVQNYSPMEIIISDDHSTDNTFDVIKNEVDGYKGDHTIILNRNKTNLGLVNHVNKILYKVSKGKYIFLAGGDDISRNERVLNSIKLFLADTNVVALGTCIQEIDSNSVKKNTKNMYCIEKNETYDLNHYLSEEYLHIYGPSRAITRELVNAFPPLNDKCSAEDRPILFRAFLLGKVAMSCEKLVNYRVHFENISHTKNKRSFDDAVYYQHIIDLNFAHKKKYINNREFKKIKKLICKRFNKTNLIKAKYKWLLSNILIIIGKIKSSLKL